MSTEKQTSVTSTTAQKHDLHHEEENWETVEDILQGQENNHKFTNDEVLTFAEATNDDQNIHVNDNYHELRKFHRKTDHIMQEEGKEDQNIVHGVLTVSHPVSQLDSNIKRTPTKISANCKNPVYHSKEESDEISWNYGDTITVENNNTEQDVAYINLEEFDEKMNINYDFMMYAVSKGMGHEDRTGDVLLGFPEIQFTEANPNEVQELYNLRNLKTELDAEKLGLNDIGEIKIYENRIIDQNNQEVASYDETVLEIDDYPTNIMETMAQAYTSSFESSAKIGRAFAKMWE